MDGSEDLGIDVSRLEDDVLERLVGPAFRLTVRIPPLVADELRGLAERLGATQGEVMGTLVIEAMGVASEDPQAVADRVGEFQQLVLGARIESRRREADRRRGPGEVSGPGGRGGG